MVVLNPPVEMSRRPDELIILPLNDMSINVVVHESVALVKIQYEYVNPALVDGEPRAIDAVYRCGPMT